MKLLFTVFKWHKKCLKQKKEADLNHTKKKAKGNITNIEIIFFKYLLIKTLFFCSAKMTQKVSKPKNELHEKKRPKGNVLI